ncbi:MAG: PKD domain-containing protein [Bacteroidota bacterium]
MLVCSQGSFGQGQATWWYFGNNAGCAFTSSPPVPATGGQVNTIEGSATISDANGNLLFYTDGQRVWNRNHIQMPNGFGLMGNASSTQSGVIVKRPGSNNIYYVFTADAQVGPGGIRYSEVDMNLQAGFGDVTANKNVLLYTPSTEKICAIRHCNNTDVWVVTHRWGSNQFSAYLVTAAGVNVTPVNSNNGTVHSGSSANTIGYMKVSPDGNKLAVAVRYTTGGGQPGYVELFDFNNQTGVVSNGFVLSNIQYAYGVEFSPNSQLLYAARSQPIAIYQWNLCAGTNAQIIASQVQVGTSTVGWAGSLQLGPDNKIYHPRYLSSWLGVINNPNTIGVGCNWVDQGVSIAPMTCQLGLPNFVGSYFRVPPTINSSVNPQVNCLLANFTFVSQMQNQCNNPNNNIVGVVWNFGDPNSGPSNTSTSQTPSHTYTAAGTYTVTLIVNYACYADTATTTVTLQNCGPSVVLSSGSVCLNSCTTLTATGSGGTPPYTYSWSPNLGTGSSVQACPTATTTYTVTITDAGNQTSTATATVTVNQPPVIAMSSAPMLCNGGTTTATATPSGTGPFSYSWNTTPSQSTQTATGLSAGTYNVTVTDANGCTQNAQITVTQPPLLTLASSSVSSICTACNGTATVTPSGGTPAYSYLWNNGQTTQTATGLCPGTYTVTVTDANNCTQQTTVSVTSVNQSLTSTSAQNNATCFNLCNGDATAAASGGTGPYSYVWNTTPAQSSAQATGLCSGSYTVTYTDANGCTGTSSVTITQPSPIALTASATNPTCSTPTGSATVTPSGGTPAYTYAWSTTPAQTSQTATGLPAGTYTVTVTDANGCSDTVSVTLTSQVGTLQVTSTQVNANCFGACNGTATATTSSAPPYTYLWNDGQTTQTATGLCVGNYTVTVTDANGCTGTASVTIYQPGAILATMSNPTAICTGTSTTVSVSASGGTPGYTYSWAPASGNGSSLTVTPTTTTVYTVYITDANGCTTPGQTVAITVNPLPTIQFAPDVSSGCSPVCVNFTNSTSNSVSCLWSFGDSQTSTICNPSHCYPVPGTYSVTLSVTDNNGCSNTATQSNLITVNPWATADFSVGPQPTDIFNSQLFFTDLSSTANSWLWSFGDPNNSTSTQQNPTFTYQDSGTYLVTLIVNNQYGCPDTITQTVHIEGQYAIYIPNAFTPNKDGHNEVFMPSGIGIDFDEFEMLIFDRWGNLIYKTNDINQGWDGRANGGTEIAQEDVYVWKISTRSSTNGFKHAYVGHVTLIK